MRLTSACALLVALGSSALADSPRVPAWIAPPKAQCSDFDHPDKVAAAIGDAATCTAAAAIYYRCEERWFNSPEMEQAAQTVCENATRPLGAKLEEQYETAREACETRYQSADGRIFWSAVRQCKVRLAERWAKRYPAPRQPVRRAP